MGLNQNNPDPVSKSVNNLLIPLSALTIIQAIGMFRDPGTAIHGQTMAIDRQTAAIKEQTETTAKQTDEIIKAVRESLKKE